MKTEQMELQEFMSMRMKTPKPIFIFLDADNAKNA